MAARTSAGPLKSMPSQMMRTRMPMRVSRGGALPRFQGQATTQSLRFSMGKRVHLGGEAGRVDRVHDGMASATCQIEVDHAARVS
jgi:hypothetical protein